MALSTASRPGIPRNSMTSKGARSSQWSRPVRPRRSMGSCAGRLIDLAQWVVSMGIASPVTKQILSRELRALGYRKTLGAAAPPRA